MFEVRNDLAERVIRVRLSGQMEPAELERFAAQCRQAAELHQGQSHFVIADMRGLALLHQEQAAILSGVIAYGRSHGAIFCAHVSDSAITQMQASRLARLACPESPATYEVGSLDEAEELLRAHRARLEPTLQTRAASPAPANAKRAAESIP